MQLLQAIAYAGFFVAAFLQLVSGRRRSALMFVMFAWALMLDTDNVYRAFDRLVEYANAANLLSHLAGLVGIYLFWTALRSVIQRPTAGQERRELVTLIGVLTASTVLFVLVDAPAEAP